MSRVVVAVLALLVAQAVGAATLDDFARCLTRAGVTYYMASWCPHCARQQKMFGGAIRWVNSVDCSDGCDGVKSYPTWRFKDGSRFAGVATLEFLASRTRCPLDGTDDAPSPEASDDSGDSGWRPSENHPGTRERYIGGAKIIEVPR